MSERLRSFFTRHPLLKDAVLWALPAIALGAVLRLLMLSYLPYAYWGSDSRSYFGFTDDLLGHGRFSLYDKRRYLYPIFLLGVSILPGAPLRWLPWIQHAIGLATLVPLAYSVRKTFSAWRLFIIPVTVLYGCMPIVLWYEHELLGDCIFFSGFVVMCAGWIAWVKQPDPERAQRLWWCFFAGFAVVILTRTAGRFLWPAVLGGLAVVGAWRVLRWQHWTALAALLGITLTIGQDTQGAWLLYASSFSLTRLDTPLHAEYKTEIADLVQRARASVDLLGFDKTESMEFLHFPERQTGRPLWAALGKDDLLRQKIYKDLALEGIRANPWRFLRISIGKIVASANPGDFNSERFLPQYYVEKFEHQYVNDSAEKPDRLRRLFAMRKDETLPPYSEFQHRIAPHPDSQAAAWMHSYVNAYHACARLVQGKDTDPDVRWTALAFWLLLATLFSLLPWTFRTIGILQIWAATYLVGTFLVGGTSSRYFALVWSAVLLALPVPLDAVARLIRRRQGGAS